MFSYPQKFGTYSYGTPIYNKVKCLLKTDEPVYFTIIIRYAFERITPFLISNAHFFLVFMTTMTLESEFCIFMFF